MAENETERYRRLMQQPGTVFVFGSNIAGLHGAGAARAAKQDYDARSGRGSGRMGRSYAIPTKGHDLSKSLPLVSINWYVAQFVCYAANSPAETFIVTRVGCGLAGYSDSDIAPMFRYAPPNCVLPEQWTVPTDGAEPWDMETLAAVIVGIGVEEMQEWKAARFQHADAFARRLAARVIMIRRMLCRLFGHRFDVRFHETICARCGKVRRDRLYQFGFGNRP